jgi:fused signal recognition particle receptor
MFDLLKKKLSESVKRISEKMKAGGVTAEAIKPAGPAEPKEKKIISTKEKIISRITERAVSEKDIEDYFSEIEPGLIQSDIAVEVADHMKKYMKDRLAGKEIKRGEVDSTIKGIFEESLYEIVNPGSLDIEDIVSRKKPFLALFLGFNGSGKTTSIAKVAEYLLRKNCRVVLAAADTFRAASIEQLEHHGNRLGVKVIKHQYGSDPAAVVFDAVKYAQANNCDAVLADTAGRTHVDRDLADELKKIVKVSRPDLKILVIDSLTGNDAVEQARSFDGIVGVDGVVFTKTDVNKKGGSIFSVCYAIKKPVLFLGTGQGYGDMEKFEPRKFVAGLVG